MRLPNGYGSVYKQSGGRRKPWAVRITIHKSRDKNGKLQTEKKYLGYFETQEQALNALSKYNENPYSIENHKITFAEIYERWSKEHYPKISKSAENGHRSAYASCESLYTMSFIDIRKAHLQAVVDHCGKNYPSLRKLKVLFNMTYKYAMENDVCQKDYSAFVDISQYRNKNPNSKDRTPFSKNELNLTWDAVAQDEYVSVILMLLYSGCRVGELLDLKKKDVHLDECWFEITQSKTEAGIRKVPIANKVLPYFQHWMQNSPRDYLLCNSKGETLTYDHFYTKRWLPLMESLSMKHLPHDTRHTCISLLVTAGVDERIIRRIVGHKGRGVTDTVYTHIDMQQLLDAINLI